MNDVIRAYDAKIDDVNMAKRSVVARINTSGVDRYNTVILPKGARTKNWRAAGGPVLWEHGNYAVRGTIPIANSKELWNNGGPLPSEIIAEPVFIRDEFADMLFEHYREGRIRGWSVNILPSVKSAGPPTKEELRSRPDWEGAELIYREWDLAEFSGTTVPGNADALTSDRATAMMELVRRSGLWMTDEAKSLYENAMARTMAESMGGLSGGGEALGSQKRYITHSGGKWTVHAEDGKEMGTYDSKEAAEERLREIEYFKHKDDDHRASPGQTPPSPRSAPYIDTDGQSWTIRNPDGSPIVGFPDAGTAQRCLIAMGQDRSFRAIHSDVSMADRAFGDELKRSIAAMVDLMVNGRV